MQLFLTIILKILPLYLIIFLGYIAGRFLNVSKETLATVLIYTVAPVIIFHGVLTADLNSGIFMLPLAYFLISSLLGLCFYRLTAGLFTDNTRNILSYSAGAGNIGYFGLPAAVAVFGDQAVTVVAMMFIGGMVFDSTLGFYLVARGRNSIRESLGKMFRLPFVYAFAAGLLLNISKIPLNEIYFDTVDMFRGAFSILGMMVIGAALSEFRKFIIDARFLLLAFTAKFVFWPLLMFSAVLIDYYYLKSLDMEIYRIMMMLSLVPMATNTVAFASLLKVQPAKTAVAVLLSTLFALIYMPLLVSVFWGL